MRTVAQEAEVPTYATQGEDAGKCRGRPKQKASKPIDDPKGKGKGARKRSQNPKARAAKKSQDEKEVKNLQCGSKKKPGKQNNEKGKKRSKKAKKMGKNKVSRRREILKGGSPKKPESDAKESGQSRPEAPKRQRAKSGGKPAVPAMEPKPSPQMPEHYGEQYKPPAHVTWNHVYSSAYRRAARCGGDYAKAAGQLAGRLFKEKGLVDSLCGTFRANPRSDASSTDIHPDWGW